MKIVKIFALLIFMILLLPSCSGSNPSSTDSTAIPTESNISVTDPSDTRTYINFGDEKLDIEEISLKSGALVEHIIFYNADQLIEFYSGEKSFVIQFTPTENYVYSSENEMLSIRGMIDKIYYSGEQLNLVEGGNITLNIVRTIIYPPKESGDPYEVLLSVGNSPSFLFRKGYSYFVCGEHYDWHGGVYLHDEFYAYEYAPLEDQQEFIDVLNWRRDFQLFDEIMERYPYVESKHKWE